MCDSRQSVLYCSAIIAIAIYRVTTTVVLIVRVVCAVRGVASESSYDDVESEASIPAGPAATPSGAAKKTTDAEYTDYQADEEQQATDEGTCCCSLLIVDL